MAPRQTTETLTFGVKLSPTPDPNPLAKLTNGWVLFGLALAFSIWRVIASNLVEILVEGGTLSPPISYRSSIQTRVGRVILDDKVPVIVFPVTGYVNPNWGEIRKEAVTPKENDFASRSAECTKLYNE